MKETKYALYHNDFGTFLGKTEDGVYIWSNLNDWELDKAPVLDSIEMWKRIIEDEFKTLVSSDSDVPLFENFEEFKNTFRFFKVEVYFGEAYIDMEEYMRQGYPGWGYLYVNPN